MKAEKTQPPVDAPLSDYQGYDYQAEFWGSDRDYEHQCEVSVIQQLLSKVPQPIKRFMDAGCGFGRLYPAYAEKADEITMLDYSADMLAGAKKAIGNAKNLRYLEANLYETPLEDESIDVVISVRTTHHLPDLDRLFKELHRIITPGGYLIIECPNKRHIVNLFRYLCGSKTDQSPLDHSILKHSDAFYNYHPKYFEKAVKQHFDIRKTVSTSFFRQRFLKRFVPLSILLAAEETCRSLFSRFYLTPSQFYLCRRR